jgi:hypothetical protein
MVGKDEERTKNKNQLLEIMDKCKRTRAFSNKERKREGIVKMGEAKYKQKKELGKKVRKADGKKKAQLS